MSSLITNATIQIRKDTAGNWTSNNPTPASGEFCLETDTDKIKMGDGSTAWTSLGYAAETGLVATVAAKANVSIYSTAWINRSDWTNVHLGSDDTKDTDSNLNHALSAPLSEVIVKLFISTDGTDANSLELFDTGPAGNYGFTVYAVDNNNVLVQTGALGLPYMNTAGQIAIIDTEDWYYKIVVYKLS